MAYTFVQEINTQCNCFLYPLTINKVTYAVSRGLKECNLLIKNVKLLEVQIITMVTEGLNLSPKSPVLECIEIVNTSSLSVTFISPLHSHIFNLAIKYVSCWSI